MIRTLRLLSSMVVALSVYNCNGRDVELGTGSPDSGAPVEASAAFDDGVPVVSYDGCAPIGSCRNAPPPAAIADGGVDSFTGSEACPNVNITVNPVVPRYYPGGDTAANVYPSRPQNLNPNAVNYNDCISNINLEFTLTISGLPCSDEIWVWAGPTDCIQASARDRNSGSAQCWPVAPIGAFAMAQTSTANIRAQDIVARINYASTSSTTYTPASSEACGPLAGENCSSVGLTLYFMAMEADGETVDGTSSAYALAAEIGFPDGSSCP
jgi:hypothetical protein